MNNIIRDSGPYLRVDNLIVKGQPSGSTSYAPGFPATVEVAAEATAATPAAVAIQPYLQWIKSSPICSATAMLFTTTVSLAASTGHLSVKKVTMNILTKKVQTKTHLIEPHVFLLELCLFNK